MFSRRRRSFVVFVLASAVLRRHGASQLIRDRSPLNTQAVPMMLIVMDATLLTAAIIAHAELRDDRCARRACDAALQQLRCQRRCRARSLVSRTNCTGHAMMFVDDADDVADDCGQRP